MKAIAHIQNDFPAKFGIPRQAGLIPELRATVIFEPEYRNPDALRGIDGFSHLWLLWEFSETIRSEWSPTVRPPRLGGNVRMGVFATRSPFRPNPIGLSCVELLSVRQTNDCGLVLDVGGADLMNGTPIYDIKPYAPYTDSHPEAKSGFAQDAVPRLSVVFPQELLEMLPPNRRDTLCAVLSLDPRPAYHRDPERIYCMAFAGFNIRFRAAEGVLTVVDVQKIEN